MTRLMRWTAAGILWTALAPFSEAGDVRTWNGASATGDWFIAANWLPDDKFPQDGDTVWITNKTVLLTNATAELAGFVITNSGTLVFSNWNTRLIAREIEVHATVTHVANSDTNAADGWQPDGNVSLVCSNLLVSALGTIHGDERGYRAADGNISTNGYGPGGGLRSDWKSTGASHGGRGGPSSDTMSVAPYGLTNAPVNPGSGGGCRNRTYAADGHGGGAVRIEATNVTVNGAISVNARTPTLSQSGGGSGGSIYITCRTFRSTTGVLRANGSKAQEDGGNGGGGAGGRIAIVYDTAAQADVSPQPTPFICANPGNGVSRTLIFGGYGSTTSTYTRVWLGNSEPGTVYVSDTRFFPGTVVTGSFYLAGVTNLARESLTISNAYVQLEPGATLTVTQALKIAGESSTTVPAGRLVLNDRSALSAGSVGLGRGGILWLAAGQSADLATESGLGVSVAGDFSIASNATVYALSHWTNAGSVWVTASNLTISLGGQFNADGVGYAGGYYGCSNRALDNARLFARGKGTGGGSVADWVGGGGGYGGKGGHATLFGPTYGSSNAPVEPGSGGGSHNPSDTQFNGVGGYGGGLVRITATGGTIRVDGRISANGVAGSSGGGGSGGGIWLRCRRFEGGPTGVLAANGGNGNPPNSTGGSGGGGRIAITDWLQDNYLGAVTANPGASGTLGETGTIVRLMNTEQPYWMLKVNGAPVLHGVASPYDYGNSAIADGAVVTNEVTAIAEETNGMRYWNIGWSVSNAYGASIGAGSTTQAFFTVTTNVFMTWHWTNQFYLAATSGANGALAVDVSGWHTNGVEVTLTPIASGGYQFLQWSGAGLPPGHLYDNPLTVKMDQARMIQANYTSSGGPVTRRWTGTGGWMTAANWSPAAIPGPDDSVVIQSGANTLTEPVRVASMLVSNTATLIFNGTNASLTVSGDLVVTNGGKITHDVNTATATNAAGQWVMDNRIYIICTNLIVEAGGEINVDAKGYLGSTDNAKSGCGPGGTPPGNPNYGGGYGGAPGYGAAGEGYIGLTPGTLYTYGSATAPDQPGSGAGKQTSGGSGGNGGGAIRIAASGGVTVRGLITAMGGRGGNNNGAGGSGGGIYITCRTIGGTGFVRANGGDYGNNGGAYGGGGRIAVAYDREAQASVSPTPALSCSGYGSDSAALLGAVQMNYHGWPGTIWVSDNRFFPMPDMTNSCRILFGHASSLALDRLTLSNAWVTFDNIASLTVTNQFRIEGRFGHYSLQTNGVLRTGSLMLTNGGRFYAYAAPTNGGVPGYGALVDVVGAMNVHTGSWVFPYSDPTNGGSVFFRVGDLLMAATNGGFNADGLGFAGSTAELAGYWDGYGPGRGRYGINGRQASAGYGGFGGAQDNVNNPRGQTYGDSNAPALPGSGSGYSQSRGNGGAGGGLVWIEVNRKAALNGLITVNGTRAPSNYGSGGSGGGIYIRCARLEGTGSLRADGGLYGNNSGGLGGGGGRIAVWSISGDFTGKASATNGLSDVVAYPPQTGTIVFGRLRSGTLILIR